MKIELTPEQQRVVKRRLKSGAYRNEQEVIDDALRGLVEDELFEAAVKDVGLETIRANVQEGLKQIERGEGIVLRNDAELDAFFEDIKARGRKRLAERNKAQTP